MILALFKFRRFWDGQFVLDDEFSKVSVQKQLVLTLNLCRHVRARVFTRPTVTK